MVHKSALYSAVLSTSLLLIPGGIVCAADLNTAMGIVIERADGAVAIVDTSARSVITEIQGLGDLSHASAVFSNDERYAYVFGRDGGLTRIDLKEKKISNRILQAGNSIGGAISEDGSLVAVSNYDPGGVRIFTADTLDPVLDIPSYSDGNELRSRVVGLVDAPRQRFVFTLFEAGEIWLADISDVTNPDIKRFRNIGRQPYDALITPDGRYYIAGLFGEDGLALLDLMNPDKGVKRILDGYGRGEKPLPTYKMPHLEGWAIAGGYAYIPAVGMRALVVADTGTWSEAEHIALYGQPVFAMANPNGRQVWVNFALPHNDTIQVIDTTSQEVIKQISAGKAVMHMEFTDSGKEIWVSVRDEDRVKVYDTNTFELLAQLSVRKPSGIFFTSRANKTGL